MTPSRLLVLLTAAVAFASPLAGCLETFTGRSVHYTKEFTGPWDPPAFGEVAGVPMEPCQAECGGEGSRLKLRPGAERCYVFHATSDGFLFELWYSPELAEREGANLEEYWNGAVEKLVELTGAEPSPVTGFGRVAARC